MLLRVGCSRAGQARQGPGRPVRPRTSQPQPASEVACGPCRYARSRADAALPTARRRWLVIPDMLKNAPLFKKTAPKAKAAKGAAAAKK